MTAWMDAAWSTPRLRPMEIGMVDDLSTVYLSDPVLVFTDEGEQLVCRYERDPETGFEGFISEDGAQPTVTHWTTLPKPPGRRTWAR